MGANYGIFYYNQCCYWVHNIPFTTDASGRLIRSDVVKKNISKLLASMHKETDKGITHLDYAAFFKEG